jgi:hypothetical protein
MISLSMFRLSSGVTTPQLLEAYNDDGEKYGGERVLRALRDERAVDVLTVCCRWVSFPGSSAKLAADVLLQYGGDMIGVCLATVVCGRG